MIKEGVWYKGNTKAGTTGDGSDLVAGGIRTVEVNKTAVLYILIWRQLSLLHMRQILQMPSVNVFFP